VLAVAAIALPGVGHGPLAVRAGMLAAAFGSCLALMSMWNGGRATARWLAAGTAAVSAELVAGMFGGHAHRMPTGLQGDVLVATVLLTLLAAATGELRRAPGPERARALSDLMVMGAVFGGAVYVLLANAGNTPGSGQSRIGVTILATAAVTVTASWATIGLWWPSAAHLGLLCGAALSGAAVLILQGTLAGSGHAAPLPALLFIGLAMLAGAAAVTLSRPSAAHPSATAWWIRPVLLGMSLVGAWAFFGAALISNQFLIRVGVAQMVVLSGALTVLVVVRALMGHMALNRATHQLQGALADREEAILSILLSAEAANMSESRLRMILDSAVDGVVELDASGVIVRTNGAFSRMVHVPLEQILGRSWTEIAGRADPASASLGDLPRTGEAVLTSPSGTVYVEARSSSLSTSPPGSLLMIRDVTASKLAEQTIRQLFQFLQDRDEDRTRLLKRTNSAIEAERNRIARDLHDGPIQGVTAAGLSLEAIRLMINAGNVPDAQSLLDKVRSELAEEMSNLRRVMSDLRPPLLEERGLIPAVREMCDRFARECDVEIAMDCGAYHDVPADVETLAYRVVQESLSNVSKHAGATHVRVAIEAGTGSLEVRISDDGKGFDPTEAREYLRLGKVGLASMRERSELGGGTLSIRSTPGAGTTISASLPFDVLASTPRVD
jgi:two-component system sensor histidine kinase DegS